eukprot:CAMPEP_0195511594 /NCGR_PEP_ID=MMETSP0794_2-20130614/3863_1 /TAXON_ID=515487 /ORGANISM="Stephanopyxis turris, Strain CCMP 815" /LENGTH=350 /DNA_ID=CAMNT_0040639227 /DNA_START=71 /DNA_END=1123 /DNA_ORIENTATION=+
MSTTKIPEASQDGEQEQPAVLSFGKSAVNAEETEDEEVGITVGGKLYRHATEPEQMEKCRYYENEYPSVEDLVMVRVRTVEKLAAYVNLIEYNMAEGMVLLSELSRRRIRSIAKLIRVGRDEVVMVFRVDTEKGYVDLSKRRVTPEDVPAFEAKFNKAKAVHSILRHVAQTCKVQLFDLYTHIAWPLYRAFMHAHDAFKASITQPGILDSIAMPQKVRKSLIKDIRRRLAATPIKFRADIQVTCFSKEGIEAIKTSLLAGKQAQVSEDQAISIKLIAPPLYVLSVTMFDREAGVAVLTEAIDIITAEIKQRGGDCKVDQEPHATTAEEENKLMATYTALQAQSAMVDGDD